jgi:hypothetical protein
MRWGAVALVFLFPLYLSTARGDERLEGAASGDTDFLPAGKSAPVHDIDSTLVDSTFAGWIERVLGTEVRVRWEENDCGEASGSPADSARDLPVCVEAGAVLSGGRELTIRIAVGTTGRGLVPPAVLYFAQVEGPESSLAFHSLGEVEGYLERERPFARNDSIYLDDRRNVRVITESGKDVRLVKEGPFREPRLSPDRRLIGMLPVSPVDTVEVSTEVWIYRGGRVAWRFEPGGFIRAWNFAGAGDSIAIASGGLHFAGFYVLYDLETGAERDRADDPVTDQSPAWVRSLAP